MTKEELRAQQLQPVKLVIISSVRTKKNEKDELREWKPGETGDFQRLYGDELVATQKAVLKDSPQHKAWEKKQAEKKEQQKEKEDELSELKKRIAVLEAAAAKK